ncbi:MAG: imidazole glycerol phosphate synthase subunit HisF [Desulfotalea sp.]
MNVTLLDYGAGNVRSVRNAIKKLGYNIVDVEKPQDILTAERLIFPGVGSFGSVMQKLNDLGYVEPLKQRIKEDKPFLGICVALQSLFEGSEESPGVHGLNILPGIIKKFPTGELSVPQIGWNDIEILKQSVTFNNYNSEKLYFVHSYHASIADVSSDWALTQTEYGFSFISAVEKGNVTACQFHPEKSGKAGLNILDNFLKDDPLVVGNNPQSITKTGFAKRVIACLDVRGNDKGDLVVTKGDQYDVRDKGDVRNLGKPVELAERYYKEGADEVTFLNITGFRDFPMEDQPMLEVLRQTSENVFVPLTIGGGIRNFVDSTGKEYTALDVASEYFRSGADKISIGSDAVAIAEEYIKTGKKTGQSSIESISNVYGAQAVVISVDPRRIYVKSPQDTSHNCLKTDVLGPASEEYCWYECTVKGGREGSSLDVIQLVQACEELGAGEILLNCIDKDGTNDGFEIALVDSVKKAVNIPVIASSGAGSAQHFVDVLKATDTDAALAAGIFHRKEVTISEIKEALHGANISHR